MSRGPVKQVVHDIGPAVLIVPNGILYYERESPQGQKEKSLYFFGIFVRREQIEQIRKAQQDRKILGKEGKAQTEAGKQVK